MKQNNNKMNLVDKVVYINESWHDDLSCDIQEYLIKLDALKKKAYYATVKWWIDHPYSYDCNKFIRKISEYIHGKRPYYIFIKKCNKLLKILYCMLLDRKISYGTYVGAIDYIEHMLRYVCDHSANVFRTGDLRPHVKD